MLGGVSAVILQSTRPLRRVRRWSQAINPGKHSSGIRPPQPSAFHRLQFETSCFKPPGSRSSNVSTSRSSLSIFPPLSLYVCTCICICVCLSVCTRTRRLPRYTGVRLRNEWIDNFMVNGCNRPIPYEVHFRLLQLLTTS